MVHTMHINEIKLKGETPFVKQFNRCSDLFMKAMQEDLSEEERKGYVEAWLAERYLLETGSY